MTALTTIVITSCTTIIVFVAGKSIEKLLIEPIYEYKKTVGRIANNLIYFANIYSNASAASEESKNKASDMLRRLSSELSSKTHLVPYYGFFAFLKILPKYSNSIMASSALIGLSNSVFSTDYDEINEKRNKIQKCLKIKIPKC